MNQERRANNVMRNVFYGALILAVCGAVGTFAQHYGWFGKGKTAATSASSDAGSSDRIHVALARLCAKDATKVAATLSIFDQSSVSDVEKHATVESMQGSGIDGGLRTMLHNGLRAQAADSDKTAAQAGMDLFDACMKSMLSLPSSPTASLSE